MVVRYSDHHLANGLVCILLADCQYKGDSNFGQVWFSIHRKDTEPLYHYFMYSMVSLLSGIYPLHINVTVEVDKPLAGLMCCRPFRSG